MRDNGRFVADINCSGRSWIFNIEKEYTEPRYIVLQVTYDDGKEVRRLADVPGGRGPRSLSVTIP